MPIEFDMRPGSGNKRQRRKNGQLPEAPRPSTEAPPVVATMRIRMLQSLISRHGKYKTGQVVELPILTARSWIGFGLAEQDKMLDGAPETKQEMNINRR